MIICFETNPQFPVMPNPLLSAIYEVCCEAEALKHPAKVNPKAILYSYLMAYCYTELLPHHPIKGSISIALYNYPQFSKINGNINILHPDLYLDFHVISHSNLATKLGHTINLGSCDLRKLDFGLQQKSFTLPFSSFSYFDNKKNDYINRPITEIQMFFLQPENRDFYEGNIQDSEKENLIWVPPF